MPGRYETRFSAVGGQGVLLAGDILALAAQKYEGRYSVCSLGRGAGSRKAAGPREFQREHEGAPGGFRVPGRNLP